MKGKAMLGALLLALVLGACRQGPAGTEVTVRVVMPIGDPPATASTLYRRDGPQDVTMPPIRVAYSIGEGDWQLLLPKDFGVYRFAVPPGERRYGVAVSCDPAAMQGTFGRVSVYQLTTDEATTIQVNCLDYGDLSLTSLEATAVKAPGDTGYDRARLYSELGGDHALLGTGVRLPLEAKPHRDLLVVAYDGAYQPGKIRRIRFLRDVDASNPPLSPQTVELSATDRPGTRSVAPFDAPSWATRSYFGVGFASKQGLLVPSHASGCDQPQLGVGDKAGGSYATIPNTAGGDVYLAEASADGGAYRVGEARVFGPEAEDLGFNLPQQKFDPAVEEATLPAFSALGYPESDLVGYAFAIGVSPAYRETVLVSRGWLGGATRYTLPDLSSAPGLGGSKPLAGDKVDWSASAVMASRPLGEILAADPLPLENPLPRLPGLALRLASKQGSYTVR